MNLAPRDQHADCYHVYRDGGLIGRIVPYLFPIDLGVGTVPVSRADVERHFRTMFPESHVVVL